MKIRQFGFGGLQIVLSIAVIGMMATIAVPQYQGFMSKAKLTEAFRLAGESRKKVSEFFMVSGRFPQSEGELSAVKTGTLTPPEHVREMVIERNASQGDLLIKVFLKQGVVENPAGGEQYIYVAGNQPNGGSYALEWSCGGSGVPVDLLPDDCQS